MGRLNNSLNLVFIWNIIFKNKKQLKIGLYTFCQKHCFSFSNYIFLCNITRNILLNYAWYCYWTNNKLQNTKFHKLSCVFLHFILPNKFLNLAWDDKWPMIENCFCWSLLLYAESIFWFWYGGWIHVLPGCISL